MKIRAAYPSSTRFGVIDLLKAIASQLIVLHHLAFYGPMADHARVLAPDLFGWLADEARMAVQVFLVTGGFLAARSLSPHGLPETGDPLRAVQRRFLKLTPPYLAAIALAIAASALAGRWMTHHSISAAPTLPQLAAHVLLLQDVLGYESLSAGLWYIAIDFQLYALLTMMLWLAGHACRTWRLRWFAPALIAVGVAASLFCFNRSPELDVWALYFLGSYGLGALAWWLSRAPRRHAGTMLLLAAMLLPAFGALALDYRSRIALALVVALLLAAAARVRMPPDARGIAALSYLGRISYAIFLVHFPVCLVVNAVFERFASAQPLVQVAGVLIAWGCSIAAGAAFHRWVEVPLGRLAASPRLAAAGA